MHSKVMLDTIQFMNATAERIKSELSKYPDGILISELAIKVGIKRTNTLYYIRRYLANFTEKTGRGSAHYPIRLKK